MTAGWSPVRAWLRLDLRRRWRSLLVLALLVGISSGTVTAAVAGARRGATAIDRLRAVTLPATLAVLPNQPHFDWAPVRRLPEVAALSTFPVADFGIDGHPAQNVYFPPGDDEQLRTIEKPVVLAGRLADPRRADEAVVTPPFLARTHLKIGATVTAHLYSPAEVTTGGDGPAHGPRQTLRIVGVIRSMWFNDDPNSPGSAIVTPAFFTKFRPNLLGAHDEGFLNALVRLKKDGADIPSFERDLARVTGRNDIDFINQIQVANAYKRTTTFESDALLAFGLAALVAAVVLLGQAVSRYAAVSVGDLKVLAVLGMTSRQVVAAAVIPLALASLVGVLAAGVAAGIASRLFPIGFATVAEPHPGSRLDWPILLGVGGFILLLMIAAAAVTAWWAPRAERGAVAPRRSVVATTAYRLGLPVPVVVGVRFALEPGRGRSSVPVRPALVGAVVGVLGVLAAVTFRAGVVDAGAHPERFGQTFQLGSYLGFNGQDFGPVAKAEAAWAADRDVTAVNDTRVGVATLAGAPTTLFSYAPVHGRALRTVTLSGRMPTAADEVALAPDSMKYTHLRVGDTVRVLAHGKDAGTVRLRVTGVAFVPEDAHTGYSEGGWTTAAGYRALFPDGFFKYHETHIAVRPGADLSAVIKRLAAPLGGDTSSINRAPTPAQLHDFNSVRTLPLALGAFLALLAVGATGHALATAIRRRRHDVAVLRALGITRRQARLVAVVQGTTLAAVGLVFGVPLGVALGRTVWRVVADATPMVYVAPVAVLALLLVAPVALVVGNLLATLPARRAGRLRVGDVLRAE